MAEARGGRERTREKDERASLSQMSTSRTETRFSTHSTQRSTTPGPPTLTPALSPALFLSFSVVPFRNSLLRAVKKGEANSLNECFSSSLVIRLDVARSERGSLARSSPPGFIISEINEAFYVSSDAVGAF